jgi:hypothetical protein
MAVAGSSQLFCFRPEVFADLLSLAGVYLLVRSWGARPAFLAGLLFGLGATFNPKQICFFGLLPLAMLVARSRPTGWLKAQLVLAAGGAVGVLPLLAYLSANGLTPVFFEQVFRVNGRLSNAEGWFNYVQFTYTGLLLWALAWWHLASRMRRAAGESRHALLTVGTGLFLACAAFFGKPGNLYAYGMQVSVLLAAILATPKLAELLGWLRRRPLALTALIAAVFALDITSAYLLGDHTPHFLPRCYTATLARMAGSGKVISKTPYHPITRDDATGIFSAWQYRWLREGYPDALPLWQGVAEEIRNGKPALVLATWNDPPGGADIPAAITLPISLARSGTISPAAGDSLLAFLAAHYRLVMLGSYPFWVRNDVPENDYETPARLVR